MDSWKNTKIKSKIKHRKGMRLEKEKVVLVPEGEQILSSEPDRCTVVVSLNRIDLWLEERTGCAWTGAEILEQKCCI